MSDLNKDTLNRLLELGGTQPPIVFPEGGDPFVIVPSGCEPKGVSGFHPPQRIQQNVTLDDAESFIDYVNRFKNNNSLIFSGQARDGGQIVGASFIALLDYHSNSPELKPGRCKHVARFNTLHTPEWTKWMQTNRQDFSQVEFAEWLEENSRLFVAPTGAELLELVQSLHGHANARFTGTTRLQTGAYSVSYDEDIEVRGGGTALTQDKIPLPKEVLAGIAPFQGASLYEVRARLKVRVAERRLTLRYETVDVEKIIQDSINLLVEKVKFDTGIKPLMGYA